MNPPSDQTQDTAQTSGWTAQSSFSPSAELNLGPDRAGFASLIEVVRNFQDTLAGAAPPPDVSNSIRSELSKIVAILEMHGTDERQQLFNRIPEVTGYGQTFTPKLLIDQASADEVHGRVTFTRFHLGGRWAAHGGAIALMFDTLLGRLANSGGRPRARTAYLNLDYRHVTRLETELWFRGEVVQEVGRKRYLHGTLHDGKVLCAEANGLFVELLPGQP